MKYIAIFFLSIVAISPACGSDDGRHVRDVNGSFPVSNTVNV